MVRVYERTDAILGMAVCYRFWCDLQRFADRVEHHLCGGRSGSGSVTILRLPSPQLLGVGRPPSPHPL